MRIRTLLTTASAVALSFGVMAGEVMAGNNNQLVVEQIGNSNFEDTGQSGSNSETLLQQIGNTNSASLSIGGSPSNNEDIAVRQNGSSNFAAYGGDAGGSSNNDFGVIQDGNFNTAQFSNGGNSGNQIGVHQDGNQNVVGGGLSTPDGRGFGGSTVSFTRPSLTMSLETSDPLTRQAAAGISGDGHFVAIEQVGFQNVAALSISGGNNTIVGSTSSNSPVSGRESINFNADFGSASIFDGGESVNGQTRTTGTSPGGGVSGFVGNVTGDFAVQDGVSNQMALKQDGFNNTIAFGQRGNNHSAEITQVGNNNFHLGGQK